MIRRAGHVWLVGMPGSGKTVVGRALARRMGLPFLDLDDEVERAAGRTVAEIFVADGETGFRELEAAALCIAADGPRSVVATGGGAVLSDANRGRMRRTGLVLHLDVDETVAIERLKHSPTTRPLLTEPGAWARLADQRRQHYEDVADHGGVKEWPGMPLTPDEIAASLQAYVDDDDIYGPAVVPVEVPGHRYDVLVGDPLSFDRRLRMRLPEGRRGGLAFVVADQRCSELFLERMAVALEEAGWQAVHIPIPSGERAKTLAVAEALYRQLAIREAEREDLIVALGGGATGDLAGFVAATYLRGMSVLQVPTTLLAMVDAAIGGKTAVNLPAGKNLVGAFHQPVGVLADVSALATLPEGEFRSGLGEVAKYALAFDRGLIDLLERETGRLIAANGPREYDLLADVVRRCAEIKAEIISNDERDAAERLFLNYGHTLGHALERIDAFEGRSHGEAVSIGCVFAARLAERLGVAEPGLVHRHVRVLEPLGLPTAGPLPDAGEVLDAMRMDKKRRGGLRFVLLEGVGRPTVVADVPDDVIVETLEAM